jgi:hypothetical protein
MWADCLAVRCSQHKLDTSSVSTGDWEIEHGTGLPVCDNMVSNIGTHSRWIGVCHSKPTLETTSAEHRACSPSQIRCIGYAVLLFDPFTNLIDLRASSVFTSVMMRQMIGILTKLSINTNI